MPLTLKRSPYAMPLLVVLFLAASLSLPTASKFLNPLLPTVKAATTFNVNSASDTADTNLGDGVCNDGTGACTLRADGWQFWLDKLNQFNGNFVQAEMVKAFILSIEYRQRFGQ